MEHGINSSVNANLIEITHFFQLRNNTDYTRYYLMNIENVVHHSSRSNIHKLNALTIGIDAKTIRESGCFQQTLSIQSIRMITRLMSFY